MKLTTKTIVSTLMGWASYFIMGEPEVWTVEFMRGLVLAVCFGTIIALMPDEKRKRDD